MSDTTKTEVRVIPGWVQYDVIRNDFNHADEGGSVIYFQKHKELSMDEAASLVIGDKAMPMSKVREMLNEMDDTIECVDVGGSGAFCGVPSDKFSAIATKYGVDL